MLIVQSSTAEKIPIDGISDPLKESWKLYIPIVSAMTSRPSMKQFYGRPTPSVANEDRQGDITCIVMMWNVLIQEGCKVGGYCWIAVCTRARIPAVERKTYAVGIEDD